MVSTTCMTVMFCNDSGGGGMYMSWPILLFFVWFCTVFFFLWGDAVRFSRF